MLTLKKIAVTGGLSSGKTSVCHFFQELGAHVVSADEVVHQLLNPDTDLGKQVIQLLGTDIIDNQSIDRSKIAKKVFNHPRLLKSLENLLHPAVYHELNSQYKIVRDKQEATLFVAEVPLLFETTGGHQYFDATVAVVADAKLCKERYTNSEDYEKRMARQLSQEQKASHADYVIYNNSTLQALREEVKKIYNQLTLRS